jgi:hypothetical protein
MANGAAEASRVREILAETGAESVDAAREAWWIGLRDAEAEDYQNFDQEKDAYRHGFEAALRRQTRGKTHAEAATYLKNEFPDLWEAEAFRAGYARGRQYYDRHCALKQ